MAPGRLQQYILQMARLLPAIRLSGSAARAPSNSCSAPAAAGACCQQPGAADDGISMHRHDGLRGRRLATDQVPACRSLIFHHKSLRWAGSCLHFQTGCLHDELSHSCTLAICSMDPGRSHLGNRSERTAAAPCCTAPCRAGRPCSQQSPAHRSPSAAAWVPCDDSGRSSTPR